MIVAWARPRLNARRRAVMPLTQAPLTLDVSDDGLHFLSPLEDSQLSWRAFGGWAEGNAVFALFPSVGTTLPIPKRAFTAEQLDEFREILRRNVGSTKSR